MLDNKGFDKWSGEYDESILNSKGYPFEGYYDLLAYVQSNVEIDRNTKILDLGIGTGLLTNELYKKGANIYGADFSKGMIEQAKRKMPNAQFYFCDFSSGIPKELAEEKFDYILSSYAFHHIDDESKIKFLIDLRENLNEKGRMLIADVAFETREKLELCKIASGKYWDYDECYMIGNDLVEVLESKFEKVHYRQISVCAGVLEMG